MSVSPSLTGNRLRFLTSIRSTLNRRVDLPSGGYLLFDYAEAFTVIDVNSGSSTRQSHLEETTLRTNVEAAMEIARQLIMLNQTLSASGGAPKSKAAASGKKK